MALASTWWLTAPAAVGVAPVPPVRSAPAVRNALRPLSWLADDVLFAPRLPPPVFKFHRPAAGLSTSLASSPLARAVTEAATRGHCGAALDASLAAATASDAFRVLHRSAWSCFDGTHAEVLAASRARTASALLQLVPHLEGAEPLQPGVAAGGGLERRLGAWADDGGDTGFRAAVVQELGEGPVADALARDLMLEVAVAHALDGVTERSDRAESALARRVHVALTSLHGAAGELLQIHRPEMYAEAHLAIEAIVGPAGAPRAGLSAELLEAHRSGHASRAATAHAVDGRVR